MPKVPEGNARLGISRLLSHIVREGAAPFDELQESTGLSPSTVRAWLKAMRTKDEHGVPLAVRVCAWEARGLNGLLVPVYELNTENKKDVPRPPKKTAAQRQATLRARRGKKRTAGLLGLFDDRRG